MGYTTKQNALEFFVALSEADCIFFANECSKFYNHSYNAECMESSLKKESNDLLEANKSLKSKIQALEEDLKTIEQTHKIEIASIEQILKQQLTDEIKKIEEHYKEELEEKKTEYIRLYQEQQSATSQSKKEYNKYLKNFDDRYTKFMEAARYMEKKQDYSQESGANGEQILMQMLNDSPFFELEDITNGMMEDFHVNLGFHGSEVKALIDVKNNIDKETIEEKDINKFIKNLDNKPGVHCGVLLAMNTRFKNKYQEYKVFKTKQDKPYMMISNLLARTHYEIPLLFALSVMQMLVESKSIRGEEATKVVDMCIEQWSELLKSADKMESSAKKIQNEARDLIVKIKDGIEDTKLNLAQIIKKSTELVEESSSTIIVPPSDSPPIKKLKPDGISTQE